MARRGPAALRAREPTRAGERRPYDPAVDSMTVVGQRAAASLVRVTALGAVLLLLGLAVVALTWPDADRGVAYLQPRGVPEQASLESVIHLETSDGILGGLGLGVVGGGLVASSGLSLLLVGLVGHGVRLGRLASRG